jgi:Protein of unknown function (DUF4012)
MSVTSADDNSLDEEVSVKQLPTIAQQDKDEPTVEAGLVPALVQSPTIAQQDKDEPTVEAGLVPTPIPAPALLGSQAVSTKDEEETKHTPESAPVVHVPTGPQTGDKRRRRLSFVLLSILLLSMFVSLGVALGYGISAYTTYTTLRDEAHSGVQHLLNIKTIFTGIKTHPTGFLDVTKLHRTQQELSAAHHDFQQLQYTIDHSDIIQAVTTYLPQYREQVTAARAASQIGLDVTDIGQQLVATALVLAPTFRGPLLNASSTPLITTSMVNLIGTTIDAVLPRLSDIQAQTRGMSIDALPISAQQRDQFLQLVQAVPQVEADVTQVRDLLGAANWLLGVDSPRTFLVQTLDRAELRGTGGFTGQYGELHVDGGRFAPFSLIDISLVEYADNSPTLGHLAPPQYRSWWPFANWGLRDSNISADFPTAAQTAITLYKQEVGHPVDGVIMFTPFLIEHILNIIGPIHIHGYNETITAQNLEERLHYYQQDNAGILKQIIIQPGHSSTSERKRFTALLAHDLMDQVRHAPPDEIIAIAREMLHDLKTKDLQIYFTNPQVEGLLMRYGDAAQIDRSTTQDGLYVVQENLSASKASQYVHTTLHDTVTLDASGGATHQLLMRLVYSQLGPVYGYDTYRDYVRVYVPPHSKLLSGDGFDTGTPLCGGSYAACPATSVYPHDELVCPTGEYQAGAAAPSPLDPDGAAWLPLDKIGPPTNLTSDEHGRAMFGGWVVVPKNCSMNVTLSWYVPPLSNNPYALLVQRQAGTVLELDLTILPTPGDCAVLGTAGMHVYTILGEDTLFTPPRLNPAAIAQTGCYPRMGV